MTLVRLRSGFMWRTMSATATINKYSYLPENTRSSQQTDRNKREKGDEKNQNQGFPGHCTRKLTNYTIHVAIVIVIIELITFNKHLPRCSARSRTQLRSRWIPFRSCVSQTQTGRDFLQTYCQPADSWFCVACVCFVSLYRYSCFRILLHLVSYVWHTMCGWDSLSVELFTQMFIDENYFSVRIMRFSAAFVAWMGGYGRVTRL